MTFECSEKTSQEQIVDLPVLQYGCYDIYDTRHCKAFRPFDARKLEKARAQVKKYFDPVPLEGIFESLKNNYASVLGNELELLYDMLADEYDHRYEISLEEKHAYIQKDLDRYCRKTSETWPVLFECCSYHEHGSWKLLGEAFMSRYLSYIRAAYLEDDALLDGMFLGIFPDLHDKHADMYYREFYLYKILAMYRYFGVEFPLGCAWFPFNIARDALAEDRAALQRFGPAAPREGAKRLLDVIGEARSILLRS